MRKSPEYFAYLNFIMLLCTVAFVESMKYKNHNNKHGHLSWSYSGTFIALSQMNSHTCSK